MMGPPNTKPVGVMIVILILFFSIQAGIEAGPVEGLTVLLLAFLLIVALSYVGVVAAGWIGYAAGFHKEERLSGWRFTLAFLLLPVGAFAVPVVRLLTLRPLIPLVPGPMAEEMRAELTNRGEAE